MDKIYCTVEMDGETIKSEDFICIVPSQEKGARLLYNTDALTLGMAVQMIAVEYRKAFDALTEEEQEIVKDVLNIGGSDNE